ncbi:MAG: beta-lactamase family protein, partial [Bacteroidales bacterium]|nr:beta-lactamase family protein [Bacteroidales bacterium]
MRKHLLSSLLLLAVCILVSCTSATDSIHRSTPQKAGLNPAKLSLVDDIILESIDNREIPGAVLAVVRHGSLAYLKAYGNKSVYPDTLPMTVNTVFDLASVSKPVGCAISIMQLVENGKLRLTDPVSMYIPNFEPWIDPETGRKVEIRIIDLLTHSSGMPGYITASRLVDRYGSPNPQALIDSIATTRRDFRPGTQFRYGCTNFIALQNVLQVVTGEKLSDYTQKNVFDVLGMKHTTFSPSGEILNLVAPTEKQADGSVLLGKVHDPLALLLNDGNSGNAGVFSTAEDLALLAAALMNGGEYNGKRILSPLTVETMTTVPSELKSLGRSLGWDNYSSYASNNGNLFDPERTYGHTGYTGTSMIVDPVSQTAVILLAHRVHPDDVGSVVRLRALVANAVAGAVTKPVQRTAPKKADLNPQKLALVDDLINESIKREEIPGAVLAVVRNGSVAYKKAYGHRSVYPDTLPMTVNTVFDMASVSKPVGCAIAIM